MERFSIVLVCWTTLCLLVQSEPKPVINFWKLHFQNSLIKVDACGKLRANRGSPTLMHAFKEQRYPDGDHTSLLFTLQAVASKRLVCMNKQGQFYTIRLKKKNSENYSKWRKGEHGFWIDGKSTTFDDCVLNSISFDPKVSYGPTKGIYSATHSNATIGRFISVTRNGTVRSIRRSLFAEVPSGRIRINLDQWKENFTNVVNNTIFDKKREKNKKIRICILKLNSDSIHKNLYKFIQKCKRDYNSRRKCDNNLNHRPLTYLKHNNTASRKNGPNYRKVAKYNRPR